MNRLETNEECPQTYKSNFKQLDVNEFSIKLSFYQFLSTLSQLLITLTFLILLIIFSIEIPFVEVPLVTLNHQPISRLNLDSLPIVNYNVIAFAKIKSKSIIPLPVYVEAKANLWSNTPSKYYISTSESFIIWPNSITYIKVNVNAKLPILEDLNVLGLALDACGLIGSERTKLHVNVIAKARLGYGSFSVPARTVILDLKAYCPVLENNLAQVLLAYVHSILPSEDYYNNTINDKLNIDDDFYHRY